jgi:hypothetical protein
MRIITITKETIDSYRNRLGPRPDPRVEYVVFSTTSPAGFSDRGADGVIMATAVLGRDENGIEIVEDGNASELHNLRILPLEILADASEHAADRGPIGGTVVDANWTY